MDIRFQPDNFNGDRVPEPSMRMIRSRNTRTGEPYDIESSSEQQLSETASEKRQLQLLESNKQRGIVLVACIKNVAFYITSD